MRGHPGRKHSSRKKLSSPSDHHQEIEKTEDERILWSLYMPWELGRCSLESSGRHVDVRNVIWLGTSNIGHDLIFQHQESRNDPEEMMSREEYLEIMGLLRPKVSERLGVCNDPLWCIDGRVDFTCHLSAFCVIKSHHSPSFRTFHVSREKGDLCGDIV